MSCGGVVLVHEMIFYFMDIKENRIYGLWLIVFNSVIYINYKCKLQKNYKIKQKISKFIWYST